MLYDPKWERKTKADPMSLAGLIAWLEMQPARGRYDFNDCNGKCLLDRFGIAVHGRLLSGSEHWKVCGGMTGYGKVALDKPWTFGAALARARKIAAA